MQGLLKKLWSPPVFDLMFGGLGLLCLTMLVLRAGDGFPPIAPAAQPLVKGAAVVGIIVVSGILAIFSTRLDQKLADDFMFHTLSKSAFMGMMGFLFTAILWHIFLAPRLGSLSFFSMVMVAMVVWSFCYLLTRLRGTGA